MTFLGRGERVMITIKEKVSPDFVSWVDLHEIDFGYELFSNLGGVIWIGHILRSVYQNMMLLRRYILLEKLVEETYLLM